MLLDGVLYVMTMPNPPHDEALNLADAFLRTAFSTGHHVRNQQGFDVGTSTDPGPDLAVVAGSIRDLHGRTPTTAVMIVEVADSSLSTDLTKKAELYATAGVQEYWVIDVNGQQLHVFRGPVPLPANLGQRRIARTPRSALPTPFLRSRCRIPRFVSQTCFRDGTVSGPPPGEAP